MKLFPVFYSDPDIGFRFFDNLKEFFWRNCGCYALFHYLFLLKASGRGCRNSKIGIRTETLLNSCNVIGHWKGHQRTTRWDEGFHVTLQRWGVDAVRCPPKNRLRAVEILGVASRTITPNRFAVGVTGPRPGLRAEPKPATGVGDGPTNLPVNGEGLSWTLAKGRRSAPLFLVFLFFY